MWIFPTFYLSESRIYNRVGIVSWFNCWHFLYLVVEKNNTFYSWWHLILEERWQYFAKPERLNVRNRFALGKRKGKNIINLVFHLSSLRMTHKHWKFRTRTPGCDGACDQIYVGKFFELLGILIVCTLWFPKIISSGIPSLSVEIILFVAKASATLPDVIIIL